MSRNLPRRRLWLALGGLVAVVAGLLIATLALGGSPDLVVYNGRSHYGDEQAFERFEEQTGLEVELRGGTAPELYERLRQEGDDSPADLLVTTDLANLWRADEAGLLEPVTTPALRDRVASEYRDPDGAWWGLSTRIRTPVRSTERVPDRAIADLADLGDRRFAGRLCLRTSNNEYNQSLVADRIAKHGEPATRRLLESWMANDPEVLGSDVDVLDAIAAGRCDVGLVNHYYLGRELADDPDFPVAPAWAGQDAAGAHTNLSGIGLVKGAQHREAAVRLMEFLTDAKAQRTIVANSELAANPDVPPAGHIAAWADVETDPIDVTRAGDKLDEAVELMQQVGWN